VSIPTRMIAIVENAATGATIAERAEVAELADAPDSKSGSLRGVWVQVPPSALTSLSH
jgi:hypothetical protein